MPKKYNNKKGFTLIEILVVVIIIGILASILVPTYQKYILKTRAAEALNLLEMVKTRQQVALAKSPTKTYISNAAELAPLTAGSTETAYGVDLLVNTDYTVTLNSSSQCAIVIYKQGTADEFKFAASYERPGVACVGSICNSFTTVTTNDIDSVCVLETAQQVAPPPGPVCNKTCPDFAPLNADICACICTNTSTLMDESTQSCPEPSCQDDFTGCLGDKVLTPIPTNLCNCACPPTKPIEGENNTCLDCHDACPTNMSFVWSYDRRRCETSCPENTILDDSNPSNPQCVSCAQATGGAKPFWVANTTITPSEDTGLCVVSNGGHCEPCPDDKPIWDGETCITCEELHAYAISARTQGSGGVSSGGTTTGYTYTEIAAYQIKEQATSASPKSGGTKSGDPKATGGESKTLKEDFDNAEAAFDAAKKALENIKTEISTSEFNAVKKNLDAAAAELEVAKKDNDATKAKAALDVAMKALSDTKSTAVVNAAKADLNSAKSGFDASSATSATMNTNYTQATAAGVKSPSSGSSNSVYDDLVNTYGSGPYWYPTERRCKYCYEIPEFADRPVYDEERDECVSCIEKYPARVKCSAANTSSNNGGSSGGGNSSYYGGNHEYMQMGVSLPTRFNDYITDFRANLDKYALDSGALLARQWGVGWVDEFGHEMSLDDVTDMLERCRNCKCGMSGTCSSCYGHVTYNNYTNGIPPCDSTRAGDTAAATCKQCNQTIITNPGFAHTEDCIQGAVETVTGQCICEYVPSKNKYDWTNCSAGCDFQGQINATGLPDCLGQGCQVLPVGSGGFNSYYISGNYICNVREEIKNNNTTTPPSTFDTTTQGSCEETWHGATEYVPAKPIWNNTTHQCEACPLPTLNPCVSSNGQQGQYTLSNVYYWNGGNTCAHIGGLTVSSVAGYSMPHCFTSGNGTLYKFLYCGGQGGGNASAINACSAQFYFKEAGDRDDFRTRYAGGYPESMLHTRNESGIDTSVLNFLDSLTSPQTIDAVNMYEPRTKAFYAITQLGLAPVESIYNHSGYVIVE